MKEPKFSAYKSCNMKKPSSISPGCASFCGNRRYFSSARCIKRARRDSTNKTPRDKNPTLASGAVCPSAKPELGLHCHLPMAAAPRPESGRDPGRIPGAKGAAPSCWAGVHQHLYIYEISYIFYIRSAPSKYNFFFSEKKSRS